MTRFFRLFLSAVPAAALWLFCCAGAPAADPGAGILDDAVENMMIARESDASGEGWGASVLRRSGEWYRSCADDFKDSFHTNFIKNSRWKYLVDGLGVTLEITLFASILGLALGFAVAAVRASHDRTGRLGFLNLICKIYLTVIRGTPSVVQLLVIYFVIFGTVDISKVLVAVIAFGFNSGAYVAEIVRSGIMSIDKGQFEAGRSLGLTHVQTMRFIVLPQAFKNVLPALGNEVIVLLKETSISGYIALQDLTKSGDIIRSQTYSPFLPLIAVAVIYLVLVVGLSALLGRLERRLRKNE